MKFDEESKSEKKQKKQKKKKKTKKNIQGVGGLHSAPYIAPGLTQSRQYDMMFNECSYFTDKVCLRQLWQREHSKVLTHWRTM